MSDTRPWNWYEGSPRERAEAVRSHANCCVGKRKFTNPELCALFLLNMRGLEEILLGDDWRPEYSTDPAALRGAG